MDRFTEASVEEELCDSRNLEMLLRMARRWRQPVFEAVVIEQLTLFLALYQDILHRGGNREDLQERVEQLFGWPAHAAAWEENIFPARMHPYRGEWLDRLMAESDLIWFGSGKERVSLAFRQDLELFRSPVADGEGARDAGLEHLLPERRGRYGLLEIADAAHLDSALAAELLWQQAWEGNVTSDWLLVANRFLPGVRAFFFLAAGACGIPVGRVLLFGGVSAALWNALLLAAGGLVVGNVDELLRLATRYTKAAWIGMAVVAAILAARALLKRRSARGEAP